WRETASHIVRYGLNEDHFARSSSKFNKPLIAHAFLSIEMKLFSFTFTLASCTTMLAQTASLPPAPARHIVTISPANSRGNEPSIAVNPNNPSQVVAAFQPATVTYSTDGAHTFTTAELPAIEGWRGGGDVSVAFDNKGR